MQRHIYSVKHELTLFSDEAFLSSSSTVFRQSGQTHNGSCVTLGASFSCEKSFGAVEILFVSRGGSGRSQRHNKHLSPPKKGLAPRVYCGTIGSLSLSVSIKLSSSVPYQVKTISPVYKQRCTSMHTVPCKTNLPQQFFQCIQAQTREFPMPFLQTFSSGFSWLPCCSQSKNKQYQR